MTEIVWHGRGGQGAFTAARILGSAYALKDETRFALAFPSFGPERRGAPVRAFTKLDTKPINSRSETQQGDFIIYLDETLFTDASLAAVKPTGKIIVNTKNKYSDSRIISIDAEIIAQDILKLPIVNTAMLGVLSAVSADIELSEIEKAIASIMPQRLVKGNINVVRAAKEAVK